MYVTDRGISQDYILAYTLRNIAASNGNEKAEEFRDDLVAKELTNEQLLKVQELSRKLNNNFKEAFDDHLTNGF
jgi:TPR repeat protein